MPYGRDHNLCQFFSYWISSPNHSNWLFWLFFFFIGYFERVKQFLAIVLVSLTLSSLSLSSTTNNKPQSPPFMGIPFSLDTILFFLLLFRCCRFFVSRTHFCCCCLLNVFTLLTHALTPSKKYVTSLWCWLFKEEERSDSLMVHDDAKKQKENCTRPWNKKRKKWWTIFVFRNLKDISITR